MVVGSTVLSLEMMMLLIRITPGRQLTLNIVVGDVGDDARPGKILVGFPCFGDDDDVGQ